MFPVPTLTALPDWIDTLRIRGGRRLLTDVNRSVDSLNWLAGVGYQAGDGLQSSGSLRQRLVHADVLDRVLKLR